MSLRESLLSSWHKPTVLTYVLMPLSWIYWLVFAIRKQCYGLGVFSSYRAEVPVVIVGNLTVGGTGKTPLVIHLVEQLRAKGFSPAVISRGYSGNAKSYPLEVTENTPVNESGDEPALIVKRTKVPMAVGPNRGESIDLLLAKHSIDVIISDDGLQHLALKRDIEICLLDDTVKSENRFLLPSGPYRETLSRLKSIDLIVHHQRQKADLKEGRFSMTLKASDAKPLNDENGELKRLNKTALVHAVAGIGNPQRFFDTCKSEGYNFETHAFPDHHHFSKSDLMFDDESPVLMTEKDAVKCQNFTLNDAWYLPVDANLSDGFTETLLAKLANRKNK